MKREETADEQSSSECHSIPSLLSIPGLLVRGLGPPSGQGRIGIGMMGGGAGKK